jgi:hypothetical protein
MKNKIIFSLIMLWGFSANAGVFELGGAYSYGYNSYAGGAYTSSKTWSTSLGYYFTQESEVEFSYQDSNNRDFVPNVQDISYQDQVYSLNFIYHLAGEGAPIKPYFRLGVGQLNRDASGIYYSSNYGPPGRLDQVTVIGGLGVKMKLTSRFGLKAEATSYLSGGNISTWKNNITLNIGGAFYF